MQQLNSVMTYPKSVFFIVFNEFCERFAFYGMRTVLPLYFVELKYSENTATVMFHAFSMCAYFFPLVGATIADSWLGKYRTILYLSTLYATGEVLLSVTSIPTLNLPVREISILSLFMIAIGTGGIKPCVGAFGGDQFKLPQQEAYLATFFSLFYLSINSGALLSMFVTPILRKDITCYGASTCYPLAFLVPAVLMILSIVVFFAGKRLYTIKKPEGNIIWTVIKCIVHAIFQRRRSIEKRDHWLDYADNKFDKSLIKDVKSVLKVLKLFVPLPFFWALYDQESSRWTFQATRMNGETFGYVVKPDQFQIVGPLLIVVLVPLFQFAIYPIIEKFLYISTPLRKLMVGGLLASLAFVISGILELQLEPTYAVQPSSGLAQVKIFNAINCDATLKFDNHQYYLKALDVYQNVSIPVNGSVHLDLIAEYKNCPLTVTLNYTVTANLMGREGTSVSWFITKQGISRDFEDRIEKSQTGEAKLRTLIHLDSNKVSTFQLQNGKTSYAMKVNETKFTDFIEVSHDSYELLQNNKLIFENLYLRSGGVYTLIGYASDAQTIVNLVTLAEPNSVHMFWLLPQFIVMALGEVMFSITGLEFAYSQAPASMKSLLQASWLLTVAFGNLIVIVIAEAELFDRRVYEFFLFAGLLFVDMLIFATMAKFYKYVDKDSNGDDGTELMKTKISNETNSKVS